MPIREHIFKSKYKLLSHRKFNKIIINERFKRTPPKQEKLVRKLDSFLSEETLDPIVIDENMTLIDGYCTYLLALWYRPIRRKIKIYRIKKDKADGQANISRNACGD